MTSYAMLIDGAFVPAASGKTFDVMNPATDAVIAKVPDASAKDVDARYPVLLAGLKGRALETITLSNIQIREFCCR